MPFSDPITFAQRLQSAAETLQSVVETYDNGAPLSAKLRDDAAELAGILFNYVERLRAVNLG